VGLESFLIWEKDELLTNLTDKVVENKMKIEQPAFYDKCGFNTESA